MKDINRFLKKSLFPIAHLLFTTKMESSLMCNIPSVYKDDKGNISGVFAESTFMPRNPQLIYLQTFITNAKQPTNTDQKKP